MGTNINSFTQTVADLVRNVNISLQTMEAVNESMTTEKDTVVITVEGQDPITGDPSTYNYTIPSYPFIISQLNRVMNTMDTFVSGAGVVLLNDGTYRQVTTVPVAKSPVAITDIASPTQFDIKDNWFFEDLMFPQMCVQFDLKGKIDDRSDRVVVRRLIVDNPSDEDTQWFITNFVGIARSYEDTITLLNVNSKKFWEDEEVLELPLKPTEYTGSFFITNKAVIDNSEWFYLDTLNYALTTDDVPVNNIQLKINDQLRFNDSIYVVNAIEVTEKRVKLTATVGLGKPSIGNSFNIYSTPFLEKLAQIPVGFNECNIVFIKGVNDDFNIIADSWGNSIGFYTNTLTLVNGTATFETYYNDFIVDFGRQMEGQAKEKFIPAYFGIIPTAPVITADIFAVNQINTQINSALDTDSIKNTQTQIESSKTIINSLQTTISQQKAQLVELTDPASRADLNAKITANINDLSKQTIQYQSLVRSLSTIAYANSAVISNPKYRVRGFFPIPDPVGTPPQQIIQFEYAYRYLNLDNTGVSLDTYQHTDPSTGQVLRGVFTDWQIISSPIKKKVYDPLTDTYVWSDENIADGETVNINQVDIPITKGEKVEFKIRSISEAGWPSNPLKSDWSQPVTIEFPSNLQGSDQVLNILADSEADQTAIQLDQTLSSAGVYTHLDDSVPNPNSGTGTYFKHQAQNLAFDLQTKDIDGKVTKENTVDLRNSNKTNISNRSKYFKNCYSSAIISSND